MKLEAQFTFSGIDRADIGRLLLNLPDTFRPDRYRVGEDEKSLQISAHSKISFLSKRTGLFPILENELCTYVYSDADSDFSTLSCDIQAAAEEAKSLFIKLCELNPEFAYCSLPEERRFRNFIQVEIPSGLLETWVGRDIRRYIPGFYWLTAISEKWLVRHNMNVTNLRGFAIENKQINSNLFLFEFYQQPAEWAQTMKVTSLIENTAGVFNLKDVTKELPARPNFLEANSFFSKWK
jgi:hypothetical protein